MSSESARHNNFAPAQVSPELIDMAGGRLELVARLGTGTADTVLFRTRMAPGSQVPLHSHQDPECFYVLSGRLQIFLDDTTPAWRTVQSGTSLLAANGIRHAVRNPTGEPADIVVATNNRFASFLREAGRPAAPGTNFTPPSPEDIQRILRVSQAYGYWNASPEESAAITG